MFGSETLRRRIGDFMWLWAFLGIGLMGLLTLRPSPRFPRPEHSRIVVDAGGTPVPIEEPFRGVVFQNPIGPYLSATQAPETVAVAGGRLDRAWFAQELMGRIYPGLLRRDELWTDTMFANTEAMLAYDPGAYLDGTIGPYGAFSVLRSVGLPVLFTSTLADETYDAMCYSEARIETALVGHPERGEALIADNKRAYAELAQELHPETLGAPIRVLTMFSNRSMGRFGAAHFNPFTNIYLQRVGAINASIGWSGANWDDTERILAMNPDYIFLSGSAVTPPGFPKWGVTDGPRDVMRDPRWAGLKAVQAGHVYRLPGWAPGLLENLHLQPLWVRWMAEVLHPDRMQPKLRAMLRAHFVKWFGYRLSDAEIDAQLHIDENGHQPGYTRFLRHDPAGSTQGIAR